MSRMTDGTINMTFERTTRVARRLHDEYCAIKSLRMQHAQSCRRACVTYARDYMTT
jgi:hypothetical protein